MVKTSAGKSMDKLVNVHSTAVFADTSVPTQDCQSGKSQHIEFLSQVSNFANGGMLNSGHLLPTVQQTRTISQHSGISPLRKSTLPLKSLGGHILSSLEHISPSQLIKPLGVGPFPPIGARLGTLGRLSNSVPFSNPPFEDKSLPPLRRPANEVPPSGKRNAMIKKRRLEKQAAANLQLLEQQGPLYPFHHSFRPMPGENLPSTQFNYPSLASVGPQLASSMIPQSQGQPSPEQLFEEAHVPGKGNPMTECFITAGAGLTSQPRRKGTKKTDDVQADQTSQQITAVDKDSGEKATTKGLRIDAQADAQHDETDVGKEKGDASVQGDASDPESNEDAGTEGNIRVGEAQEDGLVDVSAALGREKGLNGAEPMGIQPLEKAGTNSHQGTVAAEPEATGVAPNGLENAQAGMFTDGLKQTGGSVVGQVNGGESMQAAEVRVSNPEGGTDGSSEGAPVSASIQAQAFVSPVIASTSEAAPEALPLKRKKTGGSHPPGAQATAKKKPRMEPLPPSCLVGFPMEGRRKPCESCKKARKGGCGTKDATGRCEQIKGDAGVAVKVAKRVEPGTAEVRPWASHLPPELRAQIVAGSGELPVAGAVGTRAAPSARIPYLYFGTCPSDSTAPEPDAGKTLNSSLTASENPNSQSHSSRLNPPTAAPFGSKQKPVPRTRRHDIPTPSKILSARGPLSQQVSQIFAPSLGPPPAPGLVLLPQVAQMYGARGEKRPELTSLPSYLESFNARQKKPALQPVRVPALDQNLDARTHGANLAPIFPPPGQLSIPNLPAFRKPPTSSVGANLLAPRPSSSNLALLGPFLRAHEFARGSIPQGQPSTDVIRIRGGGPRVRKRKRSESGASKKEPKRTREETGTDGGEEATGGGRVEQDGIGPEGKGVGAAGGMEAVEAIEALEGLEGGGPGDSDTVPSPSGRYKLRRSARVKRHEEARVAVAMEGTQTGHTGVTASRGTARAPKKGRAQGADSSRQGGASDGVDDKNEKPQKGRKKAARTDSATRAKGDSSRGAGGDTAKGGRSATKRRKKQGQEQTGKEETGGVSGEDPGGSTRKGKGGRQQTGAKERAKERASVSSKAPAAPAGRKGSVKKGQGGSQKAPLIVFAHGAGAGASSSFMQRWKELLKTATGAADVITFDYPYLADGKKGAPPKAEKLIDFHTETIRQAQAKHPGCPLVLAGKSMGSRVSCMIGGQNDTGLDIAAVVCLGYPLKGMGKGPLREQTLLELKCPVLFVQGSRDSMCPLDLLADVQARMTASNDIHVVEGGDHGLAVGSRALKAQEVTQEDVELTVLEAITSFLEPLL